MRFQNYVCSSMCALGWYSMKAWNEVSEQITPEERRSEAGADLSGKRKIRSTTKKRGRP
jgi:hypothetical protein